MKAFRLLGIVAIVLSLLVVTAIQADAYKGKPPEKEKVTKVAPEGRAKPEKTKTPKPKDTSEPADPATEKVVICHKPGTPAQETLSVPESALSGHLGHGDTLGPCLELASPPEIMSTAAPTATLRITICHKPGTPAQKTLVLPEPAIPGHLGHGDTLGPCLELAPPPEIMPTAAPTATLRITICHKPGTPAQKTLVLPEPAIPGHLEHGDTLGPCGGSPLVAPVARVVTALFSLFFVFRQFLMSLPL